MYEAIGANLPVVVGKKDLYEASVQVILKECTGNIQSDSAIMYESIQQKKRSSIVTLWSAEDSVKALHRVYEKILRTHSI